MRNSARMRVWEERFKCQTQLVDRSQYKIYYCRIRPAPILVLGINPGGDPKGIMPNGVDSRVGTHRGAASATFYENNEHDLLDCNWRENNVVKLLTPLVGGNREAIRASVVKTNMAFRRSQTAKEIDRLKATDEAAPVLAEIIDFVNPRLVLLTGVAINEFTSRYCDHSSQLCQRISAANQTVFWPWLVRRKGQSGKILAVAVAHASQWSWTYERYAVAQKIVDIRSSIPDLR